VTEDGFATSLAPDTGTPHSGQLDRSDEYCFSHFSHCNNAMGIPFQFTQPSQHKHQQLIGLL